MPRLTLEDRSTAARQDFMVPEFVRPWLPRELIKVQSESRVRGKGCMPIIAAKVLSLLRAVRALRPVRKLSHDQR
jgi:hypothetical protein